MPENDIDFAPVGRKQPKEVIAQPTIAKVNDEGEDAPEDAAQSPAQSDTWGSQSLNVWRNAFNAENKSATAIVEQIASPQDLLTRQQAEGAADEFMSLNKMKSRFRNSDENHDGKLTRLELQKGIEKTAVLFPELTKPEMRTLESFTRLSGGTNGISEADLERAAMVSLTTAIEASGRSGKLGFEERRAITEWAGTLWSKDDAKKAQDKLNNALEGTGLQAKLEFSTFKNYLGKDVPITNFTLTKDAKEVDKFAYMSEWEANNSLIGGKSVDSKVILDNIDPSKTFNPEMTKQLQEVRDLENIMRSNEAEDGLITLKEAAKQKIGENAIHAHDYLQKNYARIAMLDGDGSSISKLDLSNAMIDSLAALTKNSIARDGLKTSDLVEGMLRTALDPAIVGNSKKLADTINAAIEQKGYKASITSEMNASRSAESLTLTLQNLKDPTEKQEIGRFINQRDRYDRSYERDYDDRPGPRPSGLSDYNRSMQERYDRSLEESRKQPNDPRGGQVPYYEPKR